MTRVLRFLLRAVLGFAGLAVFGLAIAWVLVSGSLPDYQTTVRASGLGAPLRIVRDANAVPHIRAASDRDAWFALGLVHAQDRLWQMEVSRRGAQGRLSAIFGERTVPLDRLVKTLGIYRAARRSADAQPPRIRAVLEAYADGVNAWIRHVNANALGRGAPEFFLFENRLAPWTPTDSVALLKMMALRLSSGARDEVLRAQFQLALPPERLADILPDYPVPAKTVVERAASIRELFPGARFAEADHLPDPDPWLEAMGPTLVPRLAGASNAWAVDASRSSSKAPLLANDPHLWLSAPGVWYLAELKGGGLRLAGGTLPGVPAVLVGHNGRVGWGLTTANLDDQDLYIERIDPADPERYLTPLGWRPFDTRQIRIEVAGGPALVETVRETRHGPVLTGDMFGARSVVPEGHVASLAWTALRAPDRNIEALIDTAYAGSLEVAIRKVAQATAPGQVVTLADANGIGLTIAGVAPRRASESRSQGRIPSPGWKSVHDWQGMVQASEALTVLAPEDGALMNANARLTDAPFPDHLSFDWAPPYRLVRIEKELRERTFHSRDSFVALQNDTVSEMARSVLPLIARDLWWREGEPAAVGLKAEALALLAEWNGEMDQHSPEPLIFSEWMRWLTRRLAADELGALFGLVEGPHPLFVERVFRDLGGASIWCDIDKTPERETCSEMAAAALSDALTRLERDYGRNVDGWRWGGAHRAVHRHTPFGYVGGAQYLVNISHETSGGDHTLMRGAYSGRGDAPFENSHASGLRIVLDFADLDRSVAIISTGQSGHPFSRWYDHLADPWARGEVIPLSTDEADALSGAAGIMEVLPEDG